MASWRRIEPTKELTVNWRTIVSKTFIDPSGVVQVFGTLFKENTKSAAIIAITEDNKVVIARQYRQGPERVLDEIPGGMVDDNEDPQNAAKRELLEETGYITGEVTKLGVAYKSAYSNITTYYYATNCRRVDNQNLDDGEFVNVALINIEKLIDNAKAANMTDSTAVLQAYDKLKALEDK